LSMRQAEIERPHRADVVPHLICTRVAAASCRPRSFALAAPLRCAGTPLSAARAPASTPLPIRSDLFPRAEFIPNICGESGTAAFGQKRAT
jgi:hypothetical protein